MNDTCVVYLARALSGMRPAEIFFQSYRRFSAGKEHDFVLIAKGFKASRELEPLLEMAAELKPRVLAISDRGLDLRAYGIAGRRLDYPYFCFFNSFSQFLAEDWLRKLHSHLSQSGVGLVGSTGSHESMYTNVLLQRAKQPDPTLFQRLWTPLRLRFCRYCFDPFPNQHVRTNAFMISRAVLLATWPRLIVTKREAYLFENGKNSLTKRVERMGLQALVVGRDGKAYDKEHWPESRTYRQSNQENLLVADNQTRQYMDSDDETRRHLSQAAWGDGAQAGTSTERA